MIFRILKKIADRPQRIERRRQRAELARLRPSNPSSDDTYLVAFPKSGGTWLSFLIANVNLQINHQPQQVTWWNIREFVYDIQESRDLPVNPFSLPHGRFIHSHSEFNPAYQRVLYLVRDPRDTLVSFYDLTTKLGWFQGSMDEFLHSDRLGISAWIRHVEGWVRQHTVLSYIQFIRYEDLKKNPVEVLSHIYRLYGLTVDPTILENAVQRSSFSAMHAMEAEYRQYSFDLGSTFKFVRKGIAGGYSDELSSSQIALVEERCAEWMQVFNYSARNNPAKDQIEKTE